ncbi:MAG: Lrp/AsnC ligand binding domain-containing protein [archaeon GBS-70-058]|nr:Lrp/AsnC ligand binding domain-containing protein [Candidatus Culexarchaeum nevadense]
MAFVFINVETGTELEVRDALLNIDGVKEVYVIYGVYDIVVKIEAEGIEELKNIISMKIRRTPNVKSTLTMIVLE